MCRCRLYRYCNRPPQPIYFRTCCITYEQAEAGNGDVLDEGRWVRLGNGTRLTDADALAAGVTVNGFNYYLYTAFLIAKYQGWSLNSEFYYRWLNNFDTSGGPVTSDIETMGIDVGGHQRWAGDLRHRYPWFRRRCRLHAGP